MSRVPFGPWSPSTPEEDNQATDYTNDALRSEVEREAQQWVDGIEEPQAYTVGETAHEIDPQTVKGLLEAKLDED